MSLDRAYDLGFGKFPMFQFGIQITIPQLFIRVKLRKQILIDKFAAKRYWPGGPQEV